MIKYYSTDETSHKVRAIAKHFDNQIDAIAKIENSMAQTPNSPALLQIKAVRLATQQSKQALVMAAESGVNIDLPGIEPENDAQGFRTLIAFKVIGFTLRRL
ncbi:MAG: hypothetical protein WBA93_31310 [Microcoleaceae cyanobacterium]